MDSWKSYAVNIDNFTVQAIIRSINNIYATEPTFVMNYLPKSLTNGILVNDKKMFNNMYPHRK